MARSSVVIAMDTTRGVERADCSQHLGLGPPQRVNAAAVARLARRPVRYGLSSNHTVLPVGVTSVPQLVAHDATMLKPNPPRSSGLSLASGIDNEPSETLPRIEPLESERSTS